MQYKASIAMFSDSSSLDQRPANPLPNHSLALRENLIDNCLFSVGVDPTRPESFRELLWGLEADVDVELDLIGN